jgi:hypothetical protein
VATTMIIQFYCYDEAPRHGIGQKALTLMPSCEHANRLPGFIRRVQIINQSSNCQLFEWGSASGSVGLQRKPADQRGRLLVPSTSMGMR